MRSLKSKIAGLISWILIGVFCMPVVAQAYSRVDVERTTSLNISAEQADIGFKIYKVADMSDTVEFTLTEEFDAYQIELEQSDQAGWRGQAQALAGYVQRDQIVPLAEGKTDESGMLHFAELTPGLYLVSGEAYETDTMEYTFTPFLVSLPNLTEEDEWDYNPIVIPKYEEQPKPEQEKIQVVKIWKDDGNEKKRPEEIVVQLLKDQDIVEEVTLNKENNWKYSWEDLDTDAVWSITEKEVPENYTVKVEKEGSSYIVTNTYKTPGTPETPGGKLPQTGQLWWPVPFLALGGIVLLLVGIMVRRRERE